MHRNCTFSEIIRDKNFIILSHEVRDKTKYIENKLNGRNLDPNASAAYHDWIKITIPRCLDINWISYWTIIDVRDILKRILSYSKISDHFSRTRTSYLFFNATRKLKLTAIRIEIIWMHFLYHKC